VHKSKEDGRLREANTEKCKISCFMFPHFPNGRKLQGTFAVFTASEIKLNSFHICVPFYLPPGHQSTVHIRTLRADFALIYYKDVKVILVTINTNKHTSQKHALSISKFIVA
jgi:hypothetical protein